MFLGCHEMNMSNYIANSCQTQLIIRSTENQNNYDKAECDILIDTGNWKTLQQLLQLALVHLL